MTTASFSGKNKSAELRTNQTNKLMDRRIVIVFEPLPQWQDVIVTVMRDVDWRLNGVLCKVANTPEEALKLLLRFGRPDLVIIGSVINPGETGYTGFNLAAEVRTMPGTSDSEVPIIFYLSSAAALEKSKSYSPYGIEKNAHSWVQLKNLITECVV